MTVTVTKLKQKRLSQKRTDADATRPDAKPFRSVFVRANSEHMSKVMRLAKGWEKMEWMTTPREESGLLLLLFCVTVQAYDYYYYHYHYCYCYC